MSRNPCPIKKSVINRFSDRAVSTFQGIPRSEKFPQMPSNAAENASNVMVQFWKVGSLLGT